jgi:hypothetical protein
MLHASCSLFTVSENLQGTIMTADGIQQTAVRKISLAQERTLAINAKRTDILSQPLSNMQEKKDLVTIQEFRVEMWAAV